MNRRERFATEGAALAALSVENARVRTFPVDEGGAYILHALLLSRSGRGIAGEARVACEFADGEGHVIPPEYDARSTVSTESLAVEVFSSDLEQHLRAADYFVSRLILAPPRAATLKVELVAALPLEVVTLDLVRRRLNGLVGRRSNRQAIVADAKEDSVRLRKVLEAAGATGRFRTGDLVVSAKNHADRVTTLVSQFSWLNFSRYYSQPRAAELLAERRRKTPKTSTFAFIGSERLYYKLSAGAHVVLAREEAPFVCLDIRPDALVVETCGEAVLSTWRQQLCGSEGEIGAAAASLIAEAKARDIPVHVVASTPEPDLYRELLACADRVVIEGGDANDAFAAIPPEKVVRVPRSFERTLAAPVVEIGRGGFRLIVPNAAAVLASEDHRRLITKLDGANVLLTDAFIDLSETQIANLLPFPTSHLLSKPQYLELLFTMQHADAVLLFMDSPVSDAEMQDLILDAIGCGAVVVALGDTTRLGAFAELVTAADGPSRLYELMRMLAHAHSREQLWLSRYRRICREFAFEQVAARLGPGSGDVNRELPLATIVTPTKRPALWPQILENFTRQTYPNKELIVIVHGAPDEAFEVPRELAGSVRILHLPASVNLGFCMNEGIKHAKGEFWFKVDDDDYYGPHFVEDLIDAYAYSGADIVGKPTYLVYLESLDLTVCRAAREERKRRGFKYDPEHPSRVPRLTGATLSGRTDEAPSFSLRRRSGVDSEWTERMSVAGKILFVSDYLNFVVFRSADKRNHTWTMPDDRFLIPGALMGTGLTKHLA